MVRKWIPRALAAAAAMALAGGCAAPSGGASASSSGPPGAPKGLVPQPHPPISDLPVPVGFALDQAQSRNYDLPGARLVDHLYTGHADKVAVKQFYLKQMPVYHWTLVASMFAQGSFILHFERDNERCDITITDAGWFNRVHIRIRLWPAGTVASPPGPSPK